MKQESRKKILDTSMILSENDIKEILFPLIAGDRIFFSGDLGAGKSTLIRALLRHHLKSPDLTVKSPTYTYYERYGVNLYHFDLYRIENPEDIFLIGASDILDDPLSICLIEWPEILGNSVKPTVTIEIEKISDTERKFTISKKV